MKLMEENVVEVFTLGHSNHSPEKFIALLKQHKIDMLIDVRSKPYSRFPHFLQANLRDLVLTHHIAYLFGGLALGGKSNYGVSTPLFLSKMETVLDHAEKHRVVLMCSEGKPKECHRAGKLTAWLHRKHPGVKTTHILPDGTLIDAKEYEPQIIPTERNSELTW